MEIRKGYKLTEVGVIPEDWGIISLEKLSSRIGDGIHTTPKYCNDESGEYFFINGNNLNNGRIVISNDTKRVSKAEYEIHKRKLNCTTVLLSINGTIGNLAFYNNENIILGKSAAYINIIEKVDRRFIYHLLKTEILKKYFDNELTGSTIKNLGLGSIRSTPIPLPPTVEEQSAIATVLSDTDALISSLEKLIAKKRNIKQGAMQKLLQPKEGWEIKKLEEIAEIKSGKRLPLGYSLTEKETSHPYIRILDMHNGSIALNDLMYVPEDVFPFIKNYRIFKDDIYISVAGTLGLVGRIPSVLDGANLTENANRITNIKCNIDYLLFVLKSNFIQSKIEAERTLGAQPKLALTRIRNFEIPLPNIDEQESIARILNDMENEIIMLNTKLEKLINIKQGMMQNLLTGKIRLL